jgi:Uma2 family endonuclease
MSEQDHHGVRPRLTLAEMLQRYRIERPVDEAADREAWQAEAARDVFGGRDSRDPAPTLSDSVAPVVEPVLSIMWQAHDEVTHMAILPQPLTLGEFLALPDEKPALEYFDGMVAQKVSPKGQHSRLQGELVWWFKQVAERPRLAMAFPELRATFAGASPVPDVAVYRWERIAWTEARTVANDFLVPPDIAIEIVSPDQSRPDLIKKCQWYVAHGVPIALLVDPDDCSVLDFHPHGRTGPLRGTDEIDFSPVLPGLQLAVDELFGWLHEPPPDPAP